MRKAKHRAVYGFGGGEPACGPVAKHGLRHLEHKSFSLWRSLLKIQPFRKFWVVSLPVPSRM